jgi:chromosome segregation ATPase
MQLISPTMTRAELVESLSIEESALDRLIASKILRPGKHGLFDLAKVARAAVEFSARLEEEMASLPARLKELTTEALLEEFATVMREQESLVKKAEDAMRSAQSRIEEAQNTARSAQSRTEEAQDVMRRAQSVIENAEETHNQTVEKIRKYRYLAEELARTVRECRHVKKGTTEAELSFNRLADKALELEEQLAETGGDAGAASRLRFRH